MKIYRVARWVILAGLVVSVFLLFKTPNPVSKTQDPHAIAANVESYQNKMQQLQEAKEHGEPTEVHLSADEVSALLISLFSFFLISAGIFAGPTIPYHCTVLNPLNPDSSNVGT